MIGRAEQALVRFDVEGALAAALLQSQHPEARETQLMVAWTLMEAGRADQALERLAVLDWTHDHAGAQRLLSDLYLRAGDLAASLQTLDRAIGLASHPDSRSQRTRAHLLYELGRYREARVAYRTLSRMASLRPSDRALLAQCYIETGGRAVGIRMLESLVDMPSPPEAAVHELFVREGGAPEQRERLRGAFAKLLAPKPNHPGVLDALARFEIAAGSPARARPPIEASHALAVKTGAPTGRLGLLLARLDAADGQTAESRERVLAILDDDPTVPGVLGFAVSLYPTKDDALAAIRELTRKVPNREVPASHHALLARLYHQTGNSVMARWSYEQALTGGLDLPILKNDLAFLLAQQGHDLPRARLLARQAVQSLPNEPGAIDTLGFVLLELEDYANAADQFRSALELAQERGLPQATIQYHLGLALAKLQRFFEAEQAFVLALDLGEGFSDEAAAKHQLAILRGEI
jgi:tetratricopeptide (TPR) repeat protein